MSPEMPASVEDLIREVSNLKTVVTDAVEDGVRSAMKAARQSRHAAEDVLDDTKRAVRQNPFEAIGIAFAAGVLVGCLTTLIGFRRR